MGEDLVTYSSKVSAHIVNLGTLSSPSISWCGVVLLLQKTELYIFSFVLT